MVLVIIRMEKWWLLFLDITLMCVCVCVCLQQIHCTLQFIYIRDVVCITIGWLHRLALVFHFYTIVDMEGYSSFGCCNRCNSMVSLSSLQVRHRIYSNIYCNTLLHFLCRLEGDSYTQFKAMLISLSLHLILLMFELLACDNLTSKRHLWVLVFIPLIFGSVASVGACVWAVKHDRSFELELFLAVNALQFVSLPLKLDQFVTWNWEVVFVPMWIVICLSLVSEYMTL